VITGSSATGRRTVRGRAQSPTETGCGKPGGRELSVSKYSCRADTSRTDVRSRALGCVRTTWRATRIRSSVSALRLVDTGTRRPRATDPRDVVTPVRNRPERPPYPLSDRYPPNEVQMSTADGSRILERSV
jgi:hypothetical protein